MNKPTDAVHIVISRWGDVEAVHRTPAGAEKKVASLQEEYLGDFDQCRWLVEEWPLHD